MLGTVDRSVGISIRLVGSQKPSFARSVEGRFPQDWGAERLSGEIGRVFLGVCGLFGICAAFFAVFRAFFGVAITVFALLRIFLLFCVARNVRCVSIVNLR